MHNPIQSEARPTDAPRARAGKRPGGSLRHSVIFHPLSVVELGKLDDVDATLAMPPGSEPAPFVGAYHMGTMKTAPTVIPQMLLLGGICASYGRAASFCEYAVSSLVMNSNRQAFPSSVCRRARRIASPICPGCSTRSLHPPMSRASAA